MIGAPLHERPDRRRRRVEHRDAIARADLPEAVALRPIGGALVHQHGGTVGERAVHHVRVPGDPADVGGAPEDVLVLQVEDVLRRRRHLGEVSAGSVDDPLRLPGCARRIEDEEHVLGVHRLGRARRRCLFQQPVPPVVTSLLHGREGLVALAARAAAYHDDVSNGGTAGDGLVGEALEWQHAAAPVAAIGGDEHRALRVVDAIAKGLRREAAKHHRVHGANACAGQHRDRRLGDHRQVDRHTIALLHAECLQRVGAAPDLLAQLPVGVHAAIAGLAFPDDRRLVAPRTAEVPVDTIGGDVELATAEPLRVRGRPFKHRLPRPGPGERPGLLRPECEAIARGVIIERLGAERPAGECRWGREAARFTEQRIDLR